jgi:integrase
VEVTNPKTKIDASSARMWRIWPYINASPAVATSQVNRYDCSAKSILNIHGYLSMCLDVAVAERLIRVNPCTVSDLPKWERKEPRFLTEGELARVVELTPAHWKPLIVFLAASGARISESLGLKWQNVDLLTGCVTFAT